MLPLPRDRDRDTASMNNRPPMPIHPRPYRHLNPNVTSNGGHPPQGSIAVPPGSHNHNPAPNFYPPRAGFVPNDQPHQRNSFKYRSGGQHHRGRGDGFHHQNYGNRRDQVRGNQDWNAHQRNFNANYRSPRFVPPFVRPPPPAQYYVPPPPQPVWPFGGSYGYQGMMSLL